MCSFVTPNNHWRGFLGIGQSCPSAAGKAAVVSQVRVAVTTGESLFSYQVRHSLCNQFIKRLTKLIWLLPLAVLVAFALNLT